MTLRQRFSKDPLKVVRQLDAFPKIPEECQQSTRIGGTRKQNKYQSFDRISLNSMFLCSSFRDQPSIDHLHHLQRNNVLHG